MEENGFGGFLSIQLKYLCRDNYSAADLIIIFATRKLCVNFDVLKKDSFDRSIDRTQQQQEATERILCWFSPYSGENINK